MSNPKPPYPPEFRAEAVRLARAPGNTIRQVARDLGVASESLRRWVIQADLDAVAARLNGRPRKTLDYRTPAAMLAEAAASTDWLRWIRA